MAILQGNFTRRVFSIWNNNFHVLEFDTGTRTVNTIYRGSERLDIKGAEYVLQGSWRQSERHGWQFYIRSLEQSESYTARHADQMANLLSMVTA